MFTSYIWRNALGLVLDKNADIDVDATTFCTLKQQPTGRQVAPHGHSMTRNEPDFNVTP